MTITYRQATLDDMEGLLPLLVEMHGEVGLCNLDIDKTIEEVERIVLHGLCLIACDDDDESGSESIVGAVGVMQDQLWYSSDLVLTDRFYFVSPLYRKTRIAVTLLRYIREYARTHELPLMLGVMSKVDAVRKDRLFSSMQYAGSAWCENFPLA